MTADQLATLKAAPGAVAIEALIDKLEAGGPSKRIRNAIRTELWKWAVQCKGMTDQLTELRERYEAVICPGCGKGRCDNSTTRCTRAMRPQGNTLVRWRTP